MEPLPRGANFIRAKTLWEIGRISRESRDPL